MNTKEQKEVLENALVYYELNNSCKIVADQIKGKTFALAVKRDDVLEVLSNYMTYAEMNAYFFGYWAGRTGKLLK